MRRSFVLASMLVTGALALAACGDDGGPEEATEGDASQPAEEPSAARSGGVRVVSTVEAAAIRTDPPEDLVVLDVRTPEEFAEGHLEEAKLIDFYRDDFADQIASLDRDQPYLLYCRSGNRSSQARALMADLGFADVADIDGGIVAWTDAGLPVTSG